MASNRKGFRGYVFSRAIGDHRVPQHIQNLVIRDYAARRNMHYLLSGTEYAMEGSYLVMEQVLDELPSLEGIILYSMFMLPPERPEREAIYRRILQGGGRLHSAVEAFVLAEEADIERWENILGTAGICRKLDYQEIERWLT